jgi:hypothetical protein
MRFPWLREGVYPRLESGAFYPKQTIQIRAFERYRHRDRVLSYFCHSVHGKVPLPGLNYTGMGIAKYSR